MWSADKEDDQSEGEEDSSEEDEEDEDGQQGGATQGSTENRDDRKALKKARKEAAIAKQKSRTIEVGDMPSSDEDGDDGMPANPNHSKSARKQAKASDPIEEVTEGVKKMAAPGNRKEREALEAAAARERYLKLQAEGKTDQAQADLARLRLIREQRAADAARRQVRSKSICCCANYD